MNVFAVDSIKNVKKPGYKYPVFYFSKDDLLNYVILNPA